MNFQNELKKLNILLDEETGHLFYNRIFTPPNLGFELVIVRHGETYGNCGQTTPACEIDVKAVKLGIRDPKKRIYQGMVDKPINQLTPNGINQALAAANKLEKQFLQRGWIPDIIYHSPLNRAQNTGAPFVKHNRFDDRYFSHNDIREMSFGVWENRRICDIESTHPCHSLYLHQNALVKESGLNHDGVYQDAECFCDVLLRANQFLQKLSTNNHGQKILLFSHSMFGAACCILLGHGQKIENDDYLAFDGKRKNGSSYTLPHAEPILLQS